MIKSFRLNAYAAYLECISSRVGHLLQLMQQQQEGSEVLETPEKKSWQTLHGAWGKRPVKQAQYNSGNVLLTLQYRNYTVHNFRPYKKTLRSILKLPLDLVPGSFQNRKKIQSESNLAKCTIYVFP